MHEVSPIGPRPRIRILKSDEDVDAGPIRIGEARVYVSVRAGETHVSICDDEGYREKHWVAIFGWSALLSLPVSLGERMVTLDEQETLEAALSGPIKIFGREVDTGDFIAAAARKMSEGLDDILGQTIGSGAPYSSIVLAAPEWLHDTLALARMIRPHIIQEPIEL